VTEPLRPIEWTGSAIRVIDQTELPGRLVRIDLEHVDDLVAAIVRLAVRGAPQLGAVGALGVGLAMVQGRREGWTADALDDAIDRIRAARPTAVNLAWGVDRVRPLVAHGVDAVVAAAQAIIEQDERNNHEIGRRGADWIQARFPAASASSPTATPGRSPRPSGGPRSGSSASSTPAIRSSSSTPTRPGRCCRVLV
jgi:methylthioribose-1-phosphate isomerase